MTKYQLLKDVNNKNGFMSLGVASTRMMAGRNAEREYYTPPDQPRNSRTSNPPKQTTYKPKAKPLKPKSGATFGKQETNVETQPKPMPTGFESVTTSKSTQPFGSNPSPPKRPQSGPTFGKQETNVETKPKPMPTGFESVSTTENPKYQTKEGTVTSITDQAETDKKVQDEIDRINKVETDRLAKEETDRLALEKKQQEEMNIALKAKKKKKALADEAEAKAKAKATKEKNEANDREENSFSKVEVKADGKVEELNFDPTKELFTTNKVSLGLDALAENVETPYSQGVKASGLERDNFQIKRTINVENIENIFSQTILFNLGVYSDNLSDNDGYIVREDENGNELQNPIYFTQSKGNLYITIRGSQTLENWRTNLKMGVGDIRDYSNLIYYLTTDTPKMEFHKGYLNYINDVFPLIYEEILKYKGSIDGIIFNGHSSGSAISSIIYYCYNQAIGTLNGDNPIARFCVGYGSPRFLKNGYEDIYNKACPNLIRCWNSKDVVVYFPLNSSVKMNAVSKAMYTNVITPIEYIHVGKSFCLDQDYDNLNGNLLVKTILEKNINNLYGFIAGKEQEETKKIIEQVVLNQQFQAVLVGSTLHLLENYELKEEVSSASIKYLGLDVLRQVEKITTSSYNDKCSLFKDFGLDEYFRDVAPVGEDPMMIDVSLAMLASLSTQVNKDVDKIHSIINYQMLINKLINRQDEFKKDFFEPFKDFPIPINLTTEEALMEDTKERLDKNVNMENQYADFGIVNYLPTVTAVYEGEFDNFDVVEYQ